MSKLSRDARYRANNKHRISARYRTVSGSVWLWRQIQTWLWQERHK